MKRRNFLKLLGMTAVGAMVPTALIEKRAPAPIALPARVSYNGTYASVYRDTFPTLNAPVSDLSGATLTPQMFDKACANLMKVNSLGRRIPIYVSPLSR